MKLFNFTAKPEFVEGPKDQNGTSGENVTFQCVTKATPNALVQWFSNGKELDGKQYFLVFMHK